MADKKLTLEKPSLDDSDTDSLHKTPDFSPPKDTKMDSPPESHEKMVYSYSPVNYEKVTYADSPPADYSKITYADSPPRDYSKVAYADSPPTDYSKITYADSPPRDYSKVAYADSLPTDYSPIDKVDSPIGLPKELPVPKEKTDKLIIPKKQAAKKQSKKILDIYSRSLVSKKVSLEMSQIGSNIIPILEKKLKDSYEGKCIAEGYVKRNSIKIISYSSGKINNFGVIYEVVFECYICFPVEGQLINCIATNITKAGIKGSSIEKPSPFIVFVSRDHLASNKKFSDINENDQFVARIIGQRFELNDQYISIIAEIKEKEKRYR